MIRGPHRKPAPTRGRSQAFSDPQARGFRLRVVGDTCPRASPHCSMAPENHGSNVPQSCGTSWPLSAFLVFLFNPLLYKMGSCLPFISLDNEKFSLGPYKPKGWHPLTKTPPSHHSQVGRWTRPYQARPHWPCVVAPPLATLPGLLVLGALGWSFAAIGP